MCLNFLHLRLVVQIRCHRPGTTHEERCETWFRQMVSSRMEQEQTLNHHLNQQETQIKFETSIFDKPKRMVSLQKMFFFFARFLLHQPDALSDLEGQGEAGVPEKGKKTQSQKACLSKVKKYK